MAAEPEDRSDVRATCIWAALQRAGVPTDNWFPRRYWNLAIRSAAGVASAPRLLDHTKAAVESGLIDVERGRGLKKGQVKLLPVGHRGQIVPGYTQEELLAVVNGEAGRADPAEPAPTPQP